MKRKVDFCPILQYTCVLSSDNGNVKYCTTAEKFEYDMRSLVENGYTSLSLAEYRKKKCAKENMQKNFCVIFLGGYEDTYTNAYPILKRFGIKASIFVTTELVGAKVDTTDPNFTPHFNWAEAQEMIDSGLVNIYPFLYQPDYRSNLQEDLHKKISLLNASLHNNGEIFAVFGCDIRVANSFRSIGIDTLIIGCIGLKHADVQNGGAPAISVEYTEEALDILDYFDRLCFEMLEKDNVKRTTAIYQAPNNDLLSESIILPIDRKPKIKNYLRHAFPFSAMQSNYPHKAERVILNLCIDTICKPQYNCFDFHNDSYEMWECIDCKTITRELLEINRLSIVDYIINGLKLGYYSDVWLDTYYIPGKPGYKKLHQGHGILIYGFEADKQSFLAISYTDQLQYCEIVAPIEEVAKGASNEFFTRLNLFRVNPEVNVRYDIRKMYRALLDYIHSVHHYVPTSYHKDCEEQYVQLEASVALTNHFSKCFSEKREIHPVAMYGYTEHKRIMLWRLCYISEREKLDFPEIQNRCEETQRNATWLVNAALKYNMKPSEQLLASICNKMELLNHAEAISIDTVLALLRNKYSL